MFSLFIIGNVSASGWETETESSQKALIYFDTGKAVISQKGVAKLKALKIKNNSQVIVIGKTDSRGSDEYNITLGMRRASSVSNALGVPVSASSVGEQDATRTDKAEMWYDRVALVKVITTDIVQNPIFGLREGQRLMGPTHSLQYNTIPVR